MFEDIFKRKTPDHARLRDYGFEVCGSGWRYVTRVMSGEFELSVDIDGSASAAAVANVTTTLIELSTGEEYVLYKTDAAGSYVGMIRSEIEAALCDIAEKCFAASAFASAQAAMAIEYVGKTYGDSPEFLWEKFSDNAIWRRKDNSKWYGAILTVAGRKLGLDTDKTVEVIDLRMDKSKREEILSHEGYYPGWHMNKISWYSILLDGKVPDEELKKRIDESYILAAK